MPQPTSPARAAAARAGIGVSLSAKERQRDRSSMNEYRRRRVAGIWRVVRDDERRTTEHDSDRCRHEDSYECFAGHETSLCSNDGNQILHRFTSDGLPPTIVHTAGVDAKWPLPADLVNGPAVPSYVRRLRRYTDGFCSCSNAWTIMFTES